MTREPKDEQATPPQFSGNEPVDIRPVPPPRPILNPDFRADHVFVDKSERVLKLMKAGETVKTYPIALGFSPLGQKRNQGDGKTPTGEYVLDWRNDQSDFYRSMHVSYPTPEQIDAAKAEGRDPGGAIMIHGQPNNSEFKNWRKIKADWTAGCIAVSNAEMDEIWRHVENGTKITIIE